MEHFKKNIDMYKLKMNLKIYILTLAATVGIFSLVGCSKNNKSEITNKPIKYSDIIIPASEMINDNDIETINEIISASEIWLSGDDTLLSDEFRTIKENRINREIPTCLNDFLLGSETELHLKSVEDNIYQLYYDTIIRFRNICYDENFIIYYTVDGEKPDNSSLSVSLNDNGYYYILNPNIPIGTPFTNFRAIAINSTGEISKELDVLYHFRYCQINFQKIQVNNDDLNQKIISSLNVLAEEKLALAQNVISEIISPQMTDIDKVKAIYNWIDENATYDVGYTQLLYLFQRDFLAEEMLLRNIVNSAITVLRGERYIICSGFADTFNILAQAADLDSHIVLGKWGQTTHMWNIVAVDDIYYHVDIINGALLTSDETLRNAGYSWNYGPFFFQSTENYLPQIECPHDYCFEEYIKTR